MKKYYNKISLKSKCLNYLFKFTGIKKVFMDEKKTIEYIDEIVKMKETYNLPQKLGMDIELIDGITIYCYGGNIKNNKGKIIIYIHGGSYIEEAISYQIKFAMEIAKKTNSTLIMPRYPLAPDGNYKTMYNHINKLYSEVLKNTNNIEFLGDSAGGGFILSYAMYLRNNNEIQPNNIIMMSPWLDISLSNDDLILSEKKDPMSGIAGNKYAGKLWADDLDLKNFLISPLYGNFENLSKITIITGEKDILRPDCIKLSKKLADINIEHNYIEYKGQGHDFGAYPTKEGNMVITDIVNIINSGDEDEQ